MFYPNNGESHGKTIGNEKGNCEHFGAEISDNFMMQVGTTEAQSLQDFVQ